MNNGQFWNIASAIMMQWFLGIVLALYIFPEERRWSWPLAFKGLAVAIALLLLVVGTMYLRGQFLHYFFSLSVSS